MKKFIALLLVVALTATISVGATMAYLQDEDSDVNVMVMGNVDIEQKEYERVVDENGDPVKGVLGKDFTGNYGITESYKLKEFTQAKPAYPAVYTKGDTAWDEFQQLWNQVGAPGSNDLFDDSMKNVIDKFVFVENTGKSDAYYRTIIAIEVPEGTESLIHNNFNSNNRFDAVEQDDSFNGTADSGNKSYFVDYITVDGVRYGLYNMTYNQVLAPNEVSRPSLLQVYLDPTAANEDCAKFGETWDILTLSQAVQVNGFETVGAAAALNTAFGKVTPENAAEWFKSVAAAGPKVEVEGTDKAAVLAAIENATTGGTVVLTEDITIAGYDANSKLVIDKAITLDLNGNTLTTECGWGGIDLKNGASIKNGTINHTGNTAAIKAFDVGSIENVVINVTETAGKTKGGIVVQNNAGNHIDVIKNVTINGATNGIECYRSTNDPAIGSMENVTINATANGIYLNGAGKIGSISNCKINGGEIGINAYLANLWHINLNIKNSTITGGTTGIDIWDEDKENTGSTVTLNYDTATVFAGNSQNIKVTLGDEITCTINGEQQ